MINDANPALGSNPIAALPAKEGDAFKGQRALPTPALHAVGPFIFLNHFGPTELRPGHAKGTPAHPHAGIETITYLLEGSNRHRDSLGNDNAVGPGAVQWMRAGRGVVHAEGPDDALQREGGRVHGIQFWINLPGPLQEARPDYRHFAAGALPRLEGNGATLTVIAGRAGGQNGPLKSFGIVQLSHLHMAAGARFLVDLIGPEAALDVAAGVVSVAGVRLGVGMLLPICGGASVTCFAETTSDVILLGGAPIDAPTLGNAPHDTSTPPELIQAARNYQACLMGDAGLQRRH